MQSGLLVVRRIEQPEAFDVAVGTSLDPRDHVVATLRDEQVTEARLALEVLLDGGAVADSRDCRHVAVGALPDREDAGFDGESRDPDRVAGGRAPTEWT